MATETHVTDLAFDNAQDRGDRRPDRPGRGHGWRRFTVPSAPPPSRRTEWLALAGFLAMTSLAGVAAALVTVPGVPNWYRALARPVGTPPDWLFGPAWTILYVLMAVSAWLVWRRVARGGATPARLRPLRLWGWQLALNAAWSPVVFGLHALGLGLVVVVGLLGAVVATQRAFARRHAVAGWLLVPYAVWVCYATYLNAGLLVLNPRL